MIEQSAVVVRVDGGNIDVEIPRQTACGSCAAKSGCGTSLLASWLPQRRLQLTFTNTISAGLGDVVALGLEERALQRNSLLLYALPMFGLLAGALIGDSISIALHMESELASVSIGLLGLIASLWVISRSTSKRAAGTDGEIKLLRVTRKTTHAEPRVLVPLKATLQPDRSRKFE